MTAPGLPVVVQWRNDPGLPSKGIWAIVVCPSCDNEASIGMAHHVVEPDGCVSPSMGCPFCPFHEFIRLDGWAA